MPRMYTFSIVAFAALALAACGADSGDQTNGGGDGTVTGTVTIEPEGIEGTVTCLDGEPLAGMRVAIVSGTVTFPEIAPETDPEGHYQLSSLSPGTFEVGVHDRDGQRIGLATVIVTVGETAKLDFSVSAVACGDSVPGRGVGPGISIDQALTSNLPGPLLINGHLHAQDGQVRLCELLAESFPAQCGGRALMVEGLDLTTMDGLTTEGSVTWSDQPVQLLGTVEGEVLTVTVTVR